MKCYSQESQPVNARRKGTTLIIVIALLGILAFLGVVFFTFASQERAAAENFSEAAKSSESEPDDIFDWMLEQVIVGPSNRLKGSILYSSSRRHALVPNLVGSDVYPYTGESIDLDYVADVPAVVSSPATDTNGVSYLEFVDSPAAQDGVETRTAPAPDVDYTYPDINNLFLAYKGWAIRENAGGTFEQVPVIIPSFFRPQYLKSGLGNGRNAVGNPNVPTDADWADAFDGTDRTTAPFATSTFRPHPDHLAGYQDDGTEVFRFVLAGEAAGLGIARGFPFIPHDATTAFGNDATSQGELGIWTGSNPTVYELDTDNDGDGIREGIWLDLQYPMQQTTEVTPRNYVVLHSVTIYDLDGLINIGVHGNLAGLEREDTGQEIVDLTTSGAARSFESTLLSASNLGLGPNEISPIWALRRDTVAAANMAAYQAQFSTDMARQFSNNTGDVPDTDIEQANMELLWLLTGRLNYDSDDNVDNLHPGRYGDDQWVYNAIHTVGGDAGTFIAGDLPRPGASGNVIDTTSSGPRFGGSYTSTGRLGFDDNQDRLEGEANTEIGTVRGFGHPTDYSGMGGFTTSELTAYDIATREFTKTGDPLSLVLYQQGTPVGPARWLSYDGYSLVRDVVSANRYIFGINQTLNNGSGDDLLTNPFFDALFDDPLETVFDIDDARNDYDNIAGPEDLFALQLDTSLLTTATDTVSQNIANLAPFAFSQASDPGFTSDAVRDRFTTYNSTPRFGAMRQPFGADGKPGLAGVDDDGDGLTDELDESTGGTIYDDTEDLTRIWEFTADTDGADNDKDGYGDGDGLFEFPPAFGTVPPYVQSTPFATPQVNDPFRPQLRRLLTVEAGEDRELLGQLPMSINHLLDVDRRSQSPTEGTVDFIRYMNQAGMRFRSLTEHPDASETGVLTTVSADVPTLGTSTIMPEYPPETTGSREFWARRDRQQMARDIYVLLYTIGGGRNDGVNVLDYTGSNNDRSGAPGMLYSEDQLRRMAQFAVNVVDALDTDNVITKFEYDKNLGIDATQGDGWNLDDDPYTANDEASLSTPILPGGETVTRNGLYPEDVGDRGVVYGVEAQQLAFSEVLGIRSQDFDPHGLPDDSVARHNNTGGDTNFLHVELQNMLPTTVDLATTQTGNTDADNAIWRIGRVDRPTSTGAQLAPTETITLMEDNDSVAGGDRFTIALAGKEGDPTNSNPTGWGTADLYLDLDDSVPGDFFQLISPDLSTTAIAPGTPNPSADLDLFHSTHLTPQRAIVTGDASKTGGEFLQTLVAHNGNHDYGNTSTALLGFDLVLQRRQNPNLPLLDADVTSNPWIEVDRIFVEFRDLYDIQTGPTTATLDFDNLRSHERREALGGTTMSVHDDSLDADLQTYDHDMNVMTAEVPYRRNTIGSPTNSLLGTGAFTTFQAHFDRDFASVGELLNIPVVGPRLLTNRFMLMQESPYQQIGGGTADPENLSNAAAMILWPDFDPTVPSIGEVPSANDNRWYRLLQFAEVPSRVHRMLGNYLNINRLPGRQNVNMYRHMEVYAGLIDDPAFADVDTSRTDGPFLSDSVSGADRWLEFLTERDGDMVTSYDTDSAGNLDFLIPGTPNASPFRSFGHRADSPADNGLEQTLLRRLTADEDDGNDATNRHMMEIGDATTHHVAAGSSVARHQLLSKVLGNTTTVSNTFIVYATVGYFEAALDPTTGLTRIGGRIDLDNPSDNGDNSVDGGEDHDTGWKQQAVFVIDRTEFLNAYDPGTGAFDWERFVKARLDVK